MYPEAKPPEPPVTTLCIEVDTGKWPKAGALLFLGKESTHHIPYDFAKALLTDSGNGSVLFEAGNHPDFKVITPEKTRIIKIDQIRSLNIWALEKPSIATRKVAILHPADALNIQAGNAILKTLEETAETTLFILITADPRKILPTIRSRCHIIRYRTREERNEKETGDPTLQQEIWRDLASLTQGSKGPIELAETWHTKDVSQMLYWIVRKFHDELKYAATQGKVIRNRSWWALFDEIREASRMLQDKIPVNSLVLLESVLIHYKRAMTLQINT